MISKLRLRCNYFIFQLLINCKIGIEKIGIVVIRQDFISNELEKYFLWFLFSQLHSFIPTSRLAHTCLIPWFTIADKWQFKGASSWQNVKVSMRISKTLLLFLLIINWIYSDGIEKKDLFKFDYFLLYKSSARKIMQRVIIYGSFQKSNTPLIVYCLFEK